MTCNACGKDVAPDTFFCSWCDEYLGARGVGKKANVFSRWVALVIDPGIGLALWLVPSLLLSGISRNLAMMFAILFPIGYLIWCITLFRQGLTPGKMLLGLQVVNQRTGNIPGFGTMFLREIVGRIVSGLFAGLGYFWALFDKSGQAWHDKLASTVVIKRSAAAPRSMAAHG